MAQSVEEKRAYHREWNRLDRLKPESKQRDVMKKSREKNYDKKLAGNRKWSSENPEKQENIRLKSRYGITLEEKNAMFFLQDGRCAVCREEVPLVVDHCHAVKRVRGLLCLKCNSGLGMFKDDPDLLEKAALYLRRFKD